MLKNTMLQTPVPRNIHRSLGLMRRRERSVTASTTSRTTAVTAHLISVTCTGVSPMP